MTDFWQNSKINLPVRLQNPWFWVGLAGVILTAMGADPADFTSWAALMKALGDLCANPYMIASVAVAVLGVFVDPTTEGLGDSQRALTYKKPAERGEAAWQ